MRSVQLFPVMSTRRIVALLDEIGVAGEPDEIGTAGGAEWFEIADHRLNVRVEHFESPADLVRALDVEGSFSALEIDRLHHSGDELGGAWVEILVSGRVDGQEEMRSLALRLLAEGGFGFDDYSGRAWTLEEIRDGLPTGVTFRA